ncbi:hypothetical protein [Rhizobium sp. L1K21]|uniref:hypothetical protein n=1 Tax=Rhizobium sp. L1K21 TaxID=2954933 RepID=UPI002092AF51|nr:hypothetical protein [Rhizobium sp. L1K21]MCO6185769.1 hypothetical protein [Rhizobium sp. L1K21]
MNTLAGYRLGESRRFKPHAGISSRFWTKLVQLIARWHNHVKSGRQRRATERALRTLDDWQLRDIGYPEFYQRQSLQNRKTPQ